MIDPVSIDVNDSFEKGWLKTQLPLIDKTQWVVSLVVLCAFAAMAIYFFVTMLQLKLNMLALGSGVFTTVLLFLVYRFITMRRLQKIETMMLAKDIRKKVIDHYRNQKQEIEFDSAEMIILLDEGAKAYLRESSVVTTIILYRNCTLLFCVIPTHGSAWTPPLLRKWFISRELKALLN